MIIPIAIVQIYSRKCSQKVYMILKTNRRDILTLIEASGNYPYFLCKSFKKTTKNTLYIPRPSSYYTSLSVIYLG